MSDEHPKTEKKQKHIPPKAWKKGQSGNPNGRPRKGSDLAGILREYLDGTIDTDGGKVSRGEAFVKAMYAAAIRGGAGAQTKILEYTVGIPVQRHEIEQTNIELNEDEINARYAEVVEKIKNDARRKK